MKILFTGMGSPHCKRSDNLNFFSLISDVASEFAEITWSNPRLTWTRTDLDKFDVIVFGFVPPTSPNANKIYAALHVLDLMYESPKLRLVIDSPQVWQYKNSIESFKRDPSQIFNTFYSSRQDYTAANTDVYKARLEDLVNKMSNPELWPTTIVPELPWSTVDRLSSALPFVPADKLAPLNLDSHILNKKNAPIARKNIWAVDAKKSSWWESLKLLLRYPGRTIKTSSKLSDIEYELSLENSLGLIIPPQERKVGTWWSYRYVQALNSSTPVVTYWQDSHKFSQHWSKLAYQVEDLEPYERQHLSDMQYDSYVAAIPDKEQSTKKLEKLMINSLKERI